MFVTIYPQLDRLNVMRLATPNTAILSAVIFNALIIAALIPLALRSVRYRPSSASALLRRNLLIYGLGGVVTPFVGIWLIDLLVRLIPGIGWRDVHTWMSQLGAGARLMTVLLGLIYPLAVWGVARPSASVSDENGLGPADPSVSGGSNEAGDSPDLLADVQARRARIAARKGIDPSAVPPDAVTASASGLDPHISPAYAALQVSRVARENGLDEDVVRRLVAENTSDPLLGDPVVNVLRLNVAVHEAR
jgi:K+-transporting ATPase c subunit